MAPCGALNFILRSLKQIPHCSSCISIFCSDIEDYFTFKCYLSWINEDKKHAVQFYIFSVALMLFSPCECSWGEIYHKKRQIWKEKVVILSSLSLLTHISVFILSAKYPHGWQTTWERIERNIERERNKLKRFVSLKKLCIKWMTGTVILSWYSKFFIVSNHIRWGNSHCICTSLLIYHAT